jgi:hypothetical protein
MSQELTTDDKILTWLHFYGIVEPVEIEEEAKEMILGALESGDVTRVYVDKENGLVIEAGYE